MSADGSGRDPVELLADSFVARLRRGEAPAVSEYAARAPEHAAEIGDLFAALVELESAKQSPASIGAAPAQREKIPEHLGDYHILRLLGAGGMGVVFEAERRSLRSRVALKILHPQFRIDPAYLARFRNEARSAARLHHTNIVTVFDYGEQDGLFYYAMQYIPGQALDRVLDEARRLRRLRDHGGAAPLAQTEDATPAVALVARSLLSGRFAEGNAVVEPTGPDDGAAPDPAPPPGLGPGPDGSWERGRYDREVARIGGQVADALAHAHAQGVIHRDIKPANLILGARGNVWMTDFGLAKLEDQDLSRSQDIVGTLRYMSPERFRGATSPAADIYALGATLYELVTFRPVFEGTDRLRLIHQIAHDPPTPPRAIDRAIPRDLEAIVLKALEKDPADRFRTAEEFGRELDRFRDNLPTDTRPLSTLERLGRWSRRSPAQAALIFMAATFTAVLAAGSTGAALALRAKTRTIGAQNATLRQTSDRLQHAERDARIGQMEAYLAQARAQRFSGREGQRFGTLEAVCQANRLLDDLGLPPDVRERRRLELRNLALASLALPDVRRVGAWPDAIRRPDADWRRFFHNAPDGTVRATRADGAELARIGFPETVHDMEPLVGPFVGITMGETRGTHGAGEHLVLCRLDGSRFVPVHEERDVASHLMYDDQTLVVSRRDGSLAVIDLERRRPPWVIADVGWLHSWSCAAHAPRVAVLSAPRVHAVRVIDLERRTYRDVDIAGEGCRVSLSPDGQTLGISFVGSGKLSFLDLATDRVVRQYEIPSPTPSLYINGTGLLMATRSFETLTTRFLETGSGRPRLTLPGSRLNFYNGYSTDGRMVAVDSLTPGLHQLWQLDPAPALRTFTRNPAGPPLSGLQRVATLIRLYSCEPAIRADGRLLALDAERSPSGEREVVLWDLASGRELGVLPGCQRPSFTADGDLLTGGRQTLRWPIRENAANPGRIDVGPPIAEPRAGRHSIWRSGPDLVDDSPDGTIRADFRDGLLIRSLGRGQEVRTLVPPTGTGKTRVTARFSPDGRFLAAVAFDGRAGYQVRLWRVGSWDEPLTFRDGESAVAFAPDARSLAVETNHGAIRLIDLCDGRLGAELARLEDPDQDRATSLAFTPDGGQIVSASEDGHCLHVWDLRAVRRLLSGWGLDWQAPPLRDAAPAGPAVMMKLDAGALAEEFQPAESREARLRGLLQDCPHDAGLRHRHLRALLDLKRNADVVSEATAALRVVPNHPDLLVDRAVAEARLGRPEAALADVATARREAPHAVVGCADELALLFNNRAWSMIAFPQPGTDLAGALAFATEAVALAGDVPNYLNTLGVALYRSSRYRDAARVHERSLRAGDGQIDPYDLFFLAMARHRLGDAAAARAHLARALAWLDDHAAFASGRGAELAAFRAEAESVLNGPTGELPDDVFAPPRRREAGKQTGDGS